MKKIALIMLSTILLCCGSACNRKGSIDDTGRYDIHAIVKNAVPYVQLGDGMIDHAWYQSADAYGRELFLYETADLDIWVICQKSDDEQTYFYQDFCYYICKEDAPITDEDLEQLKLRNDWNKPLDESKMSSVFYMEKKSHRTYEYFLQFSQGERIKEDLSSILEISSSSKIYLDGIGNDQQDNAIIFIWTTAPQNGTYEIEKRYLVRYPKDLTPTMLDYIEVDEELNQQEKFDKFRRDVDSVP